jgi:hypothetical protein
LQWQSRTSKSVRPRHVGIIPPESPSPQSPASPPHARGDHPSTTPITQFRTPSAPRTWGSSRSDALVAARWRVRPTHVGIIPIRCVTVSPAGCPPHARGDHPLSPVASLTTGLSAPRTWGSSRVRARAGSSCADRPTHVGIIPTTSPSKQQPTRPPHARGDHPCSTVLMVRRCPSTPRMWGSSHGRAMQGGTVQVRPTHVGIIPTTSVLKRQRTRPPHARGDHAVVLYLPTTKPQSTDGPCGVNR